MNNTQFEWKITRKKSVGSTSEEVPERPLRLGVLVSGSGSNLQALIDAIAKNELLDTEIALVVSNKADAQGVQRALKHRIPTIYLPWQSPGLSAAPKNAMLSASEMKLTSLLHLFQVDLIVLAGWMRIFSGSFVEQFPRRIINLHPALIPDDGTGNTFTTQDGSTIPVFRGLHVVKMALDAGVKVTGSTVHYVTPEVDAGPVLCREEVAIAEGDTEASLHERLKLVEHRLIVEAVRVWREMQ
ncbi:MAG TPA: phosphoribosylglycinamide formyltransferase [Ktedonobacteraceae bacterium]|nr:phosphoribosylglycinamide formyltransferase [Ktedonobacteraceae bacterium]